MTQAMSLQAVSFQQISRILDVTDGLGLNREWVEIPLSPEQPGKLEIIVDADQPFDEWLKLLPARIHEAQNA
jgi:hypothetical protein